MIPPLPSKVEMSDLYRMPAKWSETTSSIALYYTKNTTFDPLTKTYVSNFTDLHEILCPSLKFTHSTDYY